MGVGMIDTKIYRKDIFHGAVFVCVYLDDDPMDGFNLHELYTFKNHSEDEDLWSVHRTRDDEPIDVWSWGKKNEVSCNWDNGTTWIEFMPVIRLTDEDLFTIKLAGAEALFGKRVNDD